MLIFFGILLFVSVEIISLSFFLAFAHFFEAERNHFKVSEITKSLKSSKKQAKKSNECAIKNVENRVQIYRSFFFFSHLQQSCL